MKPFLALGLALTLSCLTLPAPARADSWLRSGQDGASRTDRPATLSAGQRPARGEVAASQDFAAECNLYGGGASTDPSGVELCTTPDGEEIIVPFP